MKHKRYKKIDEDARKYQDGTTDGTIKHIDKSLGGVRGVETDDKKS